MSIIKQFSHRYDYINFKIFSIKRFYSPLFKDPSNTKSLTVTDSALSQLKRLKQKFPEKRLRVAVEAGGCHGFQYKFSLEPKVVKELEVKEQEDSDSIFDSTSNDNTNSNNSTSQMICDNVSWSMIKDAKLDYQNELIGSAFRIIDNPVADSGCGCGVSFDLKANK